MSTQVEINGKSFLPIKDAAKLVSYSRDYVARLAREQKIVATQVSRQWFVDAVSLKNFAEASELELSVRNQRLSVERKRDQLVKQEVQVVSQIAKNKVKQVGLQAQLVAVFVLGFGLLVGAGIYTTSALFPSQTSSLARIGAVAPKSVVPEVREITEVTELAEEAKVVALSVPEEDLQSAKPQATTLFTSVTEYPLFTAEAQTRIMSSKDTEGIFLLPRGGEIKNAEDIKKLFSDEVEVKFLEENTGVITYANGEGNFFEFPFVSVPVKEAAAKAFLEESL